MRIPNQSASVMRTTFSINRIVASDVIPSGLFDWLCNWFEFPWCENPRETCIYDRTDTKCWGVVQMCKDRGWTASGKSCSSGWYACGVCFGLPW